MYFKWLSYVLGLESSLYAQTTQQPKWEKVNLKKEKVPQEFTFVVEINVASTVSFLKVLPWQHAVY